MKDPGRVGTQVLGEGGKGHAGPQAQSVGSKPRNWGGASPFCYSLKVGLTSSTKEAVLRTKVIVWLSHRGMDQLTFDLWQRGP